MQQQTVVLITGVSSGIGRAAAERFARTGCIVYGSVRNRAKATPMNNVELVEMDIRDAASVTRVVDGIVGHSGRIDVLVNNAGANLVGAVEETSVDEAAALFDINVLGILRTVQAVLPHMRASRKGRIVNVSSVLGFLPAPYMGVYAASKHAVEGLSETLDHELRQFGIRVTLVEPAYTKTSLGSNSPVAQATIADYDRERGVVARTVTHSIDTAPEPHGVAATVVEAALGRWRMRRTPAGQASLLSKLRRFLPASAVDGSLRKQLGLR
ncbi:short-chain dehydrogenase [Xanthomonas axonopodis pv. martyniicola]|uniref:oxidoreductase n=1 Tax=Xanthomonas axonopodis TaxID=53413 RepID=UPI0009967451|nr:oxidoreductase [Xanthomonas axonopodis]OOW66629.1 short-chain dehydrogenase [Xanthomonas axonopodis pv. martyniicola]OOW96267.1 short-chain dehydrogenase [Xanthomonas campestris pv. vitiscarnosae]